MWRFITGEFVTMFYLMYIEKNKLKSNFSTKEAKYTWEFSNWLLSYSVYWLTIEDRMWDIYIMRLLDKVLFDILALHF